MLTFCSQLNSCQFDNGWLDTHEWVREKHSNLETVIAHKHTDTNTSLPPMKDRCVGYIHLFMELKVLCGPFIFQPLFLPCINLSTHLTAANAVTQHKRDWFYSAIMTTHAYTLSHKQLKSSGALHPERTLLYAYSCAHMKDTLHCSTAFIYLPLSRWCILSLCVSVCVCVTLSESRVARS